MKLPFKALSCKSRVDILKLLMKEGEMHISKVAKKMKISVPVVARHIAILEETGLVERKGRSHLIYPKINELFRITENLFELSPIYEVEVKKESTILDALKRVPGIEVKKIREGEYITSIDGTTGYYIYEVNGKLPEITIDKYKINNEAEVKLKKLISITQKTLHLKVI